MKRTTILRLLAELREHVQNGMPHDLVFKPTGHLNDGEINKLQAALNESFDLYRETWLYPWIEMLEKATGVLELKR